MATMYWVGGTGTWKRFTPGHWSYTSGGPSNGTYPASTDDVVFNASSGTGGVTIAATVDDEWPVCKSLTIASNNLTFGFAAGIEVYGSLDVSGMGATSNGILMTGDGARTIKTGGRVLSSIQVYGAGTVTLLDDINVSSQFVVAAESFNANGFNVSVKGFSRNSADGLLNMGSGVWTIGDGGFTVYSGTINPGTSTINMSITRDYTYLVGSPLNNVVISCDYVHGAYIGGSLSCNKFSVSPGGLVRVQGGVNIYANSFSINGSPGSNTEINSTGKFNIMNGSGNTIVVKYVKFNNANGIGKWFAGDSVDGGGNTNIIFGYPANFGFFNFF